jgi:hypothetical protein
MGSHQPHHNMPLLIGLPFLNFACVETQFPNYPIFPGLVLTE